MYKERIYLKALSIYRWCFFYGRRKIVNNKKDMFDVRNIDDVCGVLNNVLEELYGETHLEKSSFGYDNNQKIGYANWGDFETFSRKELANWLVREAKEEELQIKNPSLYDKLIQIEKEIDEDMFYEQELENDMEELEV